MGVYAGMSVGAAVLIFVRLLLVARAAVRAGRQLHEIALHGVAGSPVAFFGVPTWGPNRRLAAILGHSAPAHARGPHDRNRRDARGSDHQPLRL